MKKIVSILLSIIIFCTMVSGLTAMAADGSSIIMFDREDKTYTIGQTVKVQVRCSYSGGIAGVEGKLMHDNTVQFVSSDATTNVASNAVMFSHFDGSGSSHSSITLTFNFKVIAQGNCRFSFESMVGSTSSLSEFSIESCQWTVSLKNPSSSASSNANLKSLSVSPGTLSPKFSKDVTSYTVTIPNDKTECLVTYALADSKASAKVEGSKTMNVGLNKRTVIVTAENGTTKTYTINITRLDATGEVPDTPAELPDESKIEVFADGETMYIEENFSPDAVPAGFTTDVYEYNGAEVPCITAGAVKLFYLVMADGTGGDFYMLLTDGTFTKPQKLNAGGTDYYLFPLPEGEKLPTGYKQIELTIGEQSVLAYQSEQAELSDFVLVYAMGKNGNPGLYRYDTIDGTIQRTLGMGLVFEAEEPLDEEETEDILAIIKSLNTNGIIVAVAILAVFLLLIAAIIVLIVKIATAGRNRRYKEEELPEEEENFVPFDYVTVEDREKEE